MKNASLVAAVLVAVGCAVVFFQTSVACTPNDQELVIGGLLMGGCRK